MRVVVTGGAGFIGSHIVDELVDAGHDVVSLDNFSPDAHPGGRKPDYLNPNATHIEGDVRDPAAVAAAIAGADAICHQAGRVGLGVDFGDVEDYVSHNDVGTAVLLHALWDSKFAGNFVLASSMVIYGEGRYACEIHGLVRPAPRLVSELDSGNFEPPCPECGNSLRWELVPEDAAADPRNIYASTKLHQEHLTAAFSRESNVPVTALRYHNVYGPRMPRNTPYAGVASLFRSALERGEAPRVYEDGGQMRDFVHVRDVAHANVLALTQASNGFRAFNICSGNPQPIVHMAELLAKQAGDGSLTPVVTGQYRLGDVRHVVASPSKAASELGYTASISFDDGIAEFAHAQLREGI